MMDSVDLNPSKKLIDIPIDILERLKIIAGAVCSIEESSVPQNPQQVQIVIRASKSSGA